jgi:hypothetical protein
MWLRQYLCYPEASCASARERWQTKPRFLSARRSAQHENKAGVHPQMAACSVGRRSCAARHAWSQFLEDLRWPSQKGPSHTSIRAGSCFVQTVCGRVLSSGLYCALRRQKHSVFGIMELHRSAVKMSQQWTDSIGMGRRFGPEYAFMSTTLRFVCDTRHRVRQNTWKWSYSPFTIGSHRTLTITGMATGKEIMELRMHMEPSRIRRQCATGMPFSQRHC